MLRLFILLAFPQSGRGCDENKAKAPFINSSAEFFSDWSEKGNLMDELIALE